MSEKHVNRPKSFKITVMIITVICWASLMFYGIKTIPSADTTAARLSEMQQDVDNALVDNGWVTSSTNESKYGSAMLYRVINGSTIDGEKKAKVRRRLVDFQWRQLEKSTTKFCKKGMLLTFQDVPDAYYGHAATTLAGEFNAKTIKLCAASSPSLAP